MGHGRGRTSRRRIITDVGLVLCLQLSGGGYLNVHVTGRRLRFLLRLLLLVLLLVQHV